MGILLDSNKMEARLPVDKLTCLQAALGQCANRKSATLQELQSLIGTLQFAGKVIAPGRPFLQCIIHLTKGLKFPHWHIRLNSGFRKDIATFSPKLERSVSLFRYPGHFSARASAIHRCFRFPGVWGFLSR